MSTLTLEERADIVLWCIAFMAFLAFDWVAALATLVATVVVAPLMLAALVFTVQLDRARRRRRLAP